MHLLELAIRRWFLGVTPVFKSLKTKGGVVLIKKVSAAPDISWSMVWEITCIMRHNEALSMRSMTSKSPSLWAPFQSRHSWISKFPKVEFAQQSNNLGEAPALLAVLAFWWKMPILVARPFHHPEWVTFFEGLPSILVFWHHRVVYCQLMPKTGLIVNLLRLQ